MANRDEERLQFYLETAKHAYVPIVVNDYGHEAVKHLQNLTYSIKEIYKNIRLSDFSTITVLTSLDDVNVLDSAGMSGTEVIDYSVFTAVQCSTLVIEFHKGRLKYVTDQTLDIRAYRDRAIIYEFQEGKELFYGKSEEAELRKSPDVESYFAVRTYKDLEEALEEYGHKVARFSKCLHLEKIWLDSTKIFLSPGPEEEMRRSLIQFLSNSLRGAPDVLPEQNTGESNPVDVKVIWKYMSHDALIEIKWLGKSLKKENKTLVSYFDSRAQRGADQLAGYLDTMKTFSLNKISTGYLVVYDCRRAGTNEDTTSLTDAQKERYRNQPINFTTRHELTRKDFATPVRFFMQTS